VHLYQYWLTLEQEASGLLFPFQYLFFTLQISYSALDIRCYSGRKTSAVLLYDPVDVTVI
jgi:hypothetical protein